MAPSKERLPTSMRPMTSMPSSAVPSKWVDEWMPDYRRSEQAETRIRHVDDGSCRSWRL
jgi:hypothetical protein